jgi:hypothetical protein
MPSKKPERIETRRTEYLVYFRREGSDLEYCMSPNDWRIYELELKFLNIGVPYSLIEEFKDCIRDSLNER